MKKAWKTFTLTVKRQAIRDMKALVAKGRSVSAARKAIGQQKHLRVTPNTIYNWERLLTGRTTQSTGLAVTPKVNVSNNVIDNGLTTPRITSVNLHVPGKGNITLDHKLISQIAQLTGHVG